MSIMYDNLFWKKFLSNYGLFLLGGYIASFVFLVFMARRIGIEGSLVGDFLYKNDQGEAVVFLPFVSAAIVDIGGFLLFRLFLLLKNPPVQ